jgi:hypothetical protein
MIVTNYHKSVAMTDKLKVIPRFLSQRVGKMLVAYLADVLPFRQMMDWSTGILTTKGFLWFRVDKPWDTRVFTRETSNRLGFRLTTSGYRHIAIAIDREYVRGLTAGMDPAEEDAHDLQASHSTTTADTVDGIRGDILRSLTSRSISIFRKVTKQWHIFLGLEASDDTEASGQLRRVLCSALVSVLKRPRIEDPE